MTIINTPLKHAINTIKPAPPETGLVKEYYRDAGDGYIKKYAQSESGEEVRISGIEVSYSSAPPTVSNTDEEGDVCIVTDNGNKDGVIIDIYIFTTVGGAMWKKTSTSAIKTWQPNTQYNAGDYIFNSPYLYKRTVSGVSEPTFNETEKAKYIEISPQSSVYTQVGLPTIQSIPTAIKGDICVVTNDGTINGTIQNTWVYNGTSWVRMCEQSSGVSVVSSATERITYHPVYTHFWENKQTVFTAGEIAALGFTAVGGATVSPYPSLWNNQYMFNMTANKATVATNFTAPTSYVRHEVAITPNVANMYTISTLRDRKCSVNVWVCDPTTGEPVKRIYGQFTTTLSATNINTPQLNALNSVVGWGHTVFDGLGYYLSESVINDYKTATDTIKLAIIPGVNNYQNNVIHITGTGMASCPYGYITQSSLNNESWTNESDGDNIRRLGYVGQYEGRALCQVPAGDKKVIRIGIPDPTKDIWFAPITLIRSGDGQKNLSAGNFKIKHTSGDVDLKRVNYLVKPPISNSFAPGQGCAGWIIPSSVYASKLVTPTNSATSFLEIEIKTPAYSNVYITGWVVENVN